MGDIEIINFNINEELLVDYQLLYIHGCIKNIEQPLEQEIDFDKEEITCIVNGLTTNKWKILESQFKCLCYLEKGENKIELTTLQSRLCFRVNYFIPDFKKYILPVYIICKNSDGSFISPPHKTNDLAAALIKFKFNLRLMQTFIAEALYENGFERKTFHVKTCDDNNPNVIVFNSNLDIEDSKPMTENELYSRFHEEIIDELGEDVDRKILALMSCTRYSPDTENFDESKDRSHYVSGHGALGGGDMALFGTGSLHTWANNLEDLYACFTDDQKIDKSKLFDDSCNRKYYWANYSTTVGAAIHEIGHCLDLFHTPTGIMARGHDDMDRFFILKPSDHGKCDSLRRGSENKYKGAHWYRSSAVILNSHKWLNHDTVYDEKENRMSISLHPNLLGPTGNKESSLNPNQEVFSLKKWLSTNNMKLIGLKIWYSEYLNAIQFYGSEVVLGGSEENFKVKIHASKTHDKKTEEGETYELFFSEDEVIEKINVRSGEWIDAIQIFTNLKSTLWFGGYGGRIHEYIIPKHKKIDDWIMTYGLYVGSIKFLLEQKESTTSLMKKSLKIYSKYDVTLFETYKENGEVCYYEEYRDKNMIEIDHQKLLNIKESYIKGCVYDRYGNKLPFRFEKEDLKIADA